MNQLRLLWRAMKDLSYRRKKYIFGIGFQKTGTSSLAAALRHLGYRVSGGFGTMDPNIAENVYKHAFAKVDREGFDAFQDHPWPLLYRELDERYRGSKFILTLRPPSDWIVSVVNHFRMNSAPMREWVYGKGYPVGNEDIYIQRYTQHNEEVFEYFKDRPGDLLPLWLTEGEGWEKLCPFLDKEIPSIPFPHVNKGRYHEAK